jgi:hypothetical protein
MFLKTLMMNKLNYFLRTGIIVGLTALAGCGDDNAPEIDPKEAVTERFSNTWIVGTDATSKVLFGTEPRTDAYSAFSLTITEDNTYTTVEVDDPDPWPASGSWSFTNPENITSASQNAFSVTRDDGLIMNATLSNNDKTLQLTFEFDPEIHAGERIMAVNGQWTFILVAQ